MGNKFWKILPIDIKNELDQNKFKGKLKSFLIANLYYSFNEFLSKPGLGCVY